MDQGKRALTRKWEYKSVSVNGLLHDYLVDRCNALDKEGWEVISSTTDFRAGGYDILARRPYEEPWSPDF